MRFRTTELAASTVLTSAVLALAACSSDPSVIDAENPTFAGLPRAVAEEVASSPAARQRVQGDDEATAAARYQGMARNFIACRSALAVYQTWLRTGRAPVFPQQPRPVNPAPSAEDMDNVIKRFESQVDSGDISVLRADLTNESGCGAWIPAKAGDVNGPTIADIVNGKT